ncbi:MAG: hypothetical protein SF123_00870 [Chloroflexota bacterium]|nr:hypothetical protein [Chloroflexota bacterium]
MNTADDIKQVRTLLRRIEGHRIQTHQDRGALHETVNMVEVLYHPTSALPELNYLMPRRGAAWVSAAALQTGIERIIAVGRTPHIVYLEPLLPPVFRQTLEQVEMRRAAESSIYAVDVSDAPARAAGDMVLIAQTVGDVARWWRARSRILAGTRRFRREVRQIEAIHALAATGRALPLLIDRQADVAGIASLELQPALKTARLVEFLPLHADDRAPLLRGILHAAAARGCDLLFGAGAIFGTTDDLAAYGFTHLGSAVAYLASRVKKD